MSVKILDNIEAGLAERARRFSRPNGSHWPSKLSAWLVDDENEAAYLAGNCMRALYWTYLGLDATDPSKPNGMMKMDAGNHTESQFLDDYTRHIGFTGERQVECWVRDPRLKWPIHGFMDWRWVLRDEVGFGILDVKSTADYSLKIADGEGFKDSWWLQMCCYHKSSRTELPHMPVKMLKVLWIARGNMNRREFTKHPTDGAVDAAVEAIILRLVELEQRIGLHGEDAPGFCELPPAEFAHKGYDKYPCSYCDFKKKCKANT